MSFFLSFFVLSHYQIVRLPVLFFPELSLWDEITLHSRFFTEEMIPFFLECLLRRLRRNCSFTCDRFQCCLRGLKVCTDISWLFSFPVGITWVEFSPESFCLTFIVYNPFISWTGRQPWLDDHDHGALLFFSSLVFSTKFGYIHVTIYSFLIDRLWEQEATKQGKRPFFRMSA